MPKAIKKVVKVNIPTIMLMIPMTKTAASIK